MSETFITYQVLEIKNKISKLLKEKVFRIELNSKTIFYTSDEKIDSLYPREDRYFSDEELIEGCKFYYCLEKDASFIIKKLKKENDYFQIISFGETINFLRVRKIGFMYEVEIKNNL